jgi:cytoskeletal protein CcmA (bactofilin family)
MTMNEGKRTLIEEGTVLKGTLTSSCPVVVLGRLEGEMTGPSVDVAESGVLSGRAKVTALRSRGELAGEFDAETVELSGRVRDKTIIRAQSLEVRLERTDGRLEVMFGECELAVGEAPDKAAAVREATSGAPRAATPAPQPAASAPQPAASAEATEGGEVTAEADASPSARNVRRGKRPDDSARHADST